MKIDWEQEARYYFWKYHRDVSMLFGQSIDDKDSEIFILIQLIS